MTTRGPDRAVRAGAVSAAHRARVADILESTRRFRADEVAVALELFDDATRAAPAPSAGATRGDGVLPDYLLVGAFEAGEALLGYACYGATPATDRTFDLYWIAVDSAAQGVGVGTVLLAEVERRLRARDARLLVIETSSRSDYDAPRRFYARRGYAVAARVREFYAPADDRIIYTKRLDGGPGAGRGAVAQ